MTKKSDRVQKRIAKSYGNHGLDVFRNGGRKGGNSTWANIRAGKVKFKNPLK